MKSLKFKTLFLIFVVISTNIQSSDWYENELSDAVSISVDGDVIKGDKYTVILDPKSSKPCEIATQVTTFYSVVKNAEKKFTNLPSRYVLAAVRKGFSQEKFLMVIQGTSDFIAGKRTLFNVSVNEINQFLDFHKANNSIEIELLYFYDIEKQVRKNEKIIDYFDIPKNSWSLDGLEESILSAKVKCLEMM